jgi:heat-inducible transcriptional repressor
MRERQQQILKALIQEFIKSAQPVGSKTLMVGYNFKVSPATIRSDMASLEKEGLVAQPHTSAGRVPTDMGYRVFVNDLLDLEEARNLAKPLLQDVREKFLKEQAKKRIYDAVSVLSETTQNISFATFPDSRAFYLGLSNVLKKPEFFQDPLQASQVIEVFEHNDNFLKTIDSLDIKLNKSEIFIGQENIIPEIQSCSMIISKYNHQDFEGYIGILGPTRMNYATNSVILEEISKLINHE